VDLVHFTLNGLHYYHYGTFGPPTTSLDTKHQGTKLQQQFQPSISHSPQFAQPKKMYPLSAPQSLRLSHFPSKAPTQVGQEVSELWLQEL
jgi:hypothetical protein